MSLMLGSSPAARARVVVVEDEAIVARGIALTLRDLGHDVAAICATGDEAIAAAGRERPDLMLMDVHLRGAMDGITAAAAIRTARDVPVVFLTAYADHEHLDRATATSPHGYLVKPYTERDLRATINVVLHRHRLERALVERERWLTTTLGSIGDAVIAVDAALRVTFVNAVAAAITGWAPADAVGRAIDEVFVIAAEDGGPRDNPLRRALAERAVAGLAGPTVLHARGRTQPVPIEDSASPIIDDRGELLGGVIVFRDVTERRQLDMRLALADRMSALGTLTAGLGHELNNPLFVTHANLQFARTTLAGLAPTVPADAAAAIGTVLAVLADAEASAAQAQQIVTRLSDFARPSGRPRAPVALAAVIDRALGLADHELRHSAEVSRQLAAPAWVMGDETALVQVVTHLLTNAAQARDPDRPAHQVEVALAPLADGRAQLVVRDTGVGIPPERMVRIFEPFFTTKPVGVGNGLGLTIAHAIVRAHGGELRVTSARGDTRFYVTLPWCAPPPRARATTAPPRRARRTVLLVDDDRRVLSSLTRLLRGQHAVTSAESAEAALALIDAGLTPDVIVCDLMMPGMGGAGLYEVLGAAHPALRERMLFLTGGAFTAGGISFVEELGDRVLGKPIASATLLARIDALLALAAPLTATSET